jgi:linoleate 10R-lipoxygenase
METLDAIALTRGDRFFTTDFTPYNLTSWGFAVRLSYAT